MDEDENEDNKKITITSKRRQKYLANKLWGGVYWCYYSYTLRD